MGNQLKFGTKRGIRIWESLICVHKIYGIAEMLLPPNFIQLK